MRNGAPFTCKAMPLRTFEDSQGKICKVWDVTPFVGHETERRTTERRLAKGVVYSGPERRVGRERRMRTPGLMTPGLEAGWLCFEREEEKRRLSPVPLGWDAAAEQELESLFQRARPVTRRPLVLP